jgi:inosine-uridine nucleoside N-ribohydrolase
LALAILVALGAAGAPPPSPGSDRPIPVILATDIGDEIDDTWALVMLLRSPELTLRLVMTEHGDTVYRARLVARLLETAGRSDVPIGIGIRQSKGAGPQAEWVRDYDLGRYPGRVHEDGVQALIHTVMGSSMPLTLIAIGPAPTLRAALEREPRLAPRLRFVGVYGSLRRGDQGRSGPEAEWNVKADVAAARAILAASWREAIVTPLDTSAQVSLDGENYAAIRDAPDPLLRALMENFRVWCRHTDTCVEQSGHLARKSTTLYDTVAIYLASDEALVRTETLGVRVTDEGLTLPDRKARPVTWATAWRSPAAFASHLSHRLRGDYAGPGARVKQKLEP